MTPFESRQYEHVKLGSLLLAHVQPEDCSEIARLDQILEYTPWSVKDFETSLKAQTVLALKVVKDQEIIGYIFIQYVEDAEVLCIGTKKEYQNNGIGRLMIEEVKKHLQTMGIQNIFLDVRSSNLPAQALYTRTGFVQIGKRKNYYAAVHGFEDAIVMMHALQSVKSSEI